MHAIVFEWGLIIFSFDVKKVPFLKISNSKHPPTNPNLPLHIHTHYTPPPPTTTTAATTTHMYSLICLPVRRLRMITTWVSLHAWFCYANTKTSWFIVLFVCVCYMEQCISCVCVRCYFSVVLLSFASTAFLISFVLADQRSLLSLVLSAWRLS